MAVALADSPGSRLRRHPFGPFRAKCASHEWIRKILCFPRNLVAAVYSNSLSFLTIAFIWELWDFHQILRFNLLGPVYFETWGRHPLIKVGTPGPYLPTR
jgi:hypothetical protein